jgi:transcriptional regulator with XRE-family HTH domain
MNQSPISQRLKILIEKLGLDTRTFSQAIGVSEGTTRNYFTRGSKPNSDYLEKLSTSFESVNLHWLLTGNGTPLLPPTNENELGSANNQKFFRSQVIGANQGIANQHQHSDTSELERLRNQLLLAEKDVESLRAQLTTTNALLAAKEETITLLRASNNRPS